MKKFIPQYKSLIRIIAIVQNACWGGFIIGYTSSEMALSSDNVTAGLGATSKSQSDIFAILLIQILPIGGIFGSVLFYYLSQIISRRNIMIVADIVFIFGVFIGYNNLLTFCLMRFMQGISSAFNFCGVLIYIREIVPDHWADKAMLIFQINLNLGIIMSNVICLPLPSINFSNPNLDVDYYWRIIFAFPIIICFLRMYCLIFEYDFETPYYYYQMEEPQKQRKLMKLLYKEQYLQQIEYQLDQIGREEETDNQTYKLRKYYTVVLLGLQQMTGINVGIYSTDIFEDLFNSLQTKIIILFSSLLLLVSAIASYRFESMIVRKTKCIGSQCFILGCLNALIVIGICSSVHTLTILSLGLFYIIFNFTVGPLCLGISSDIHKEKGMAISFISYWVFNFISVGLGQALKQYINLSIFAVFSFLCFLLLFFKNKETKGIPFYQIISNQGQFSSF